MVGFLTMSLMNLRMSLRKLATVAVKPGERLELSQDLEEDLKRRSASAHELDEKVQLTSGEALIRRLRARSPQRRTG